MRRTSEEDGKNRVRADVRLQDASLCHHPQQSQNSPTDGCYNLACQIRIRTHMYIEQGYYNNNNPNLPFNLKQQYSTSRGR